MITSLVLRSYAVARSLFPPTDLQSAIDRFGFVQADPIRAPARAQDLTLRHRVADYRAGDLERSYASLAVEEDFFINYGFVTPGVRRLMHPRGRYTSWPKGRRRRADAVLAFVQERGAVHPRDVDRHFAHGRVTNYWGGSSNATTHLLDQLHYLGLLRIVRREAGVRVYGLQQPVDPPPDRAAADARLDELIDVAVRTYAPLPAPALPLLVRRFQYGTPQWRRRLPQALDRARARLARARVDGLDWYWPADEEPASTAIGDDDVRLLAPFDPIVWDRKRFELLWGWAYRFEAYTPAAKRKLGYYALPLLWGDRVIGWANVGMSGGQPATDVGFISGAAPRDRSFAHRLELEVQRIRQFLTPRGQE